MSHRVESLPLVYRNFWLASQNEPDRLALVIGDGEFSYRDLLTRVDMLANGLLRSGVGPGEHVGVLLPNCVEFVQLLLAASRIGAVIVPQSMGLSADAVNASFAASHVQHFVCWSGVDSSPATQSAFSNRVRIVVGGHRSGWLSFDEVTEAGRIDATSMPQVADEAPFLIVLTSGSTGAPKPIVLSQRAKVMRAHAAAELYQVTSLDVTLAATPLYHSLAQRLVLMPLMSGGTSILMPHFSTNAWIASVKEHGASFSIAVSTQLRQIVETLMKTGDLLPSLRCLVSSSALLDAETKAKVMTHLPCQFHECYGASEIAIATSLCSSELKKMGSVGRAAPGTEVRILNEESTWATTDVPGEIVCRTPMLFSGYLDQPQLTADAMHEGYFRTGDLGKVDADGDLFFLGRIKDIIISGGINIYPKDIEDVINAVKGVKECAAIPLMDDQLGEVVGVVCAMGDAVSADPIRQLQRACVQHLGDHQQPRSFFVVNELPKNGMGKLDKPALRRTYSTMGKNTHS